MKEVRVKKCKKCKKPIYMEQAFSVRYKIVGLDERYMGTYHYNCAN